MARPAVLAVFVALGLLGLSGCGSSGAPAAVVTTTPGPTMPPGPSTGTSPEPTPSTTAPSSPSPTPTPSATPTPAAPTPSDGHPVQATLGIPALALTGLVVQPYVGRTDDGPGTAIQNRGRGASPYGPQGGTGPGGVGNFQVTAHRTSSTAPFATLPTLVAGDLVQVDAGGVQYTYAVTTTRQTSFRSAASLAEQRAAVPGHPGALATQAIITLSTCATPEDRAAGNRWADENDNPEHRIDKIGVLVQTSPAPS